MIYTSPAAMKALANELSGISRGFTLRATGVKHTLTSAEATLRALAAEKDETVSLMADPNAVHLNLLRGTIAKPTIDQIVHLYGREALLAALAADRVVPVGAGMSQAERDAINDLLARKPDDRPDAEWADEAAQQWSTLKD